MTEHNWISVADRLPDEGVVVETKFRFDDERIWRRKLVGGQWLTHRLDLPCFDEPTHWRPIDGK